MAELPDEEEDDFAVVRAAVLYNLRELANDSLFETKEWKALNRIEQRAKASKVAVDRLTELANKYAAPYIPEMRGEGACTCLPGCVSHIAGCPHWVLQY